jgi:hypothetical protein
VQAVSCNSTTLPYSHQQLIKSFQGGWCMPLLTCAILHNPKQIKVELLTWHVDCFPYSYLIIAWKNEQCIDIFPLNFIIVRSVKLLTTDAIWRFYCCDSDTIRAVIKDGLHFCYPISKQWVWDSKKKGKRGGQNVRNVDTVGVSSTRLF